MRSDGGSGGDASGDDLALVWGEMRSPPGEGVPVTTLPRDAPLRHKAQGSMRCNVPRLARGEVPSWALIGRAGDGGGETGGDELYALVSLQRPPDVTCTACTMHRWDTRQVRVR